MKHPGFKKNLIWSTSLLVLLVLVLSLIQAPVHGEENNVGIHGEEEYTREFQIFEPVPIDHAETDDIPDGQVLEFPFLMGPSS